MRLFSLLPFLTATVVGAQMPLPFWERYDSSHVVLAALPDNAQRPDTLWANGIIPVPISALDTEVVDQCCMDPDPSILLARLNRWPTDRSGEPLPLFTEPLDADTAAWFQMGEWRTEPDTMIPLSAHPNALTRYLWTKDGLDVQTEYYGTWRSNFVHHVKRGECLLEARDSLKFMRCSPHTSYRTTEPSILLLFVNDLLLEVFHDNGATGLDTWGYFDLAPRGSIITARAGGKEAIVLSSGEVLVRGAERWELHYREPVIYRGECDCE
jgi:hypothetical protein